MKLPKTNLTYPNFFLLEVAVDGFRAYQEKDGEFELISASPKAVGTTPEIWDANCNAAMFKARRAFEKAIQEITTK